VNINATLIGQMITFALLVWFTMKYIWPPLFDSLEERKKKIVEGLAAAERGHEQILLAEKKAVAVLKEARNKSSDIISLAQKRANELVEESKEQAKKESERLILAAQAHIEQEKQRARESLRQEVAVLALSVAEQILQSEVDQAKHLEILNNVSSQFAG